MVVALVLLALLAAPAAAQRARGPGRDGTWTTGAKQGVGTSTTMASKVWYTLAEAS